MVWTIVSEGSKQGANASCNESGRCDFYSGRTVDWHETTSQQKSRPFEKKEQQHFIFTIFVWIYYRALKKQNSQFVKADFKGTTLSLWEYSRKEWKR